ncbi:hypothetical protein Pint_34423 [Pistacia integerrima]|uniref:Uncharacterized protein n=1 Tax=Pistacia integerrima TaxID=434235 RepID=A0ACC0X4U2_9ROSI|nr:hypothetical protein Pint_34423 [Pistacia integerrima]
MSMACLNMYNNEHSMNPRISFSNDFADTQQAAKQENKYREAPVSADFEFSVRNYNMKPADEIFFKGMLVPLKDNSGRKMTLREELLVGDEEEVLPRVPKISGWWKERLGLRKGHIVSKKGDRNVLEEVVEEPRPAFADDEDTVTVGKTIQELLLEGGLNCRETGI